MQLSVKIRIYGPPLKPLDACAANLARSESSLQLYVPDGGAFWRYLNNLVENVDGSPGAASRLSF